MSLRFTSEVPAIPDPDFVTQSNQTWFYERSLKDELGYYGAPLTPVLNPDRINRFFSISGANKYIEKVTVYDEEGKIDIESSSHSIGIPVLYDTCDDCRGSAGHIIGLDIHDDKPIEIHLNNNLREDRAVTFGHEVGHYFFRVVLGKQNLDSGRNFFEEEFCEYFGRTMVMPKSRLENIGEINEATLLKLSDLYGLSLKDTISQLQHYSLLPPRVALDSYNGELPNPDYSQKVVRSIVCKHCDDTAGDLNCPLAGQDCLLFDFTDQTLGSISGCCGENLHKPEIVSTLTKHYKNLGKTAISNSETA